MLLIKIPKYCIQEQKYIIEVMIGEFLGLDFKIETYEKEYIQINQSKSIEKKSNSEITVTVDANLFKNLKNNWLSPNSLPILPLLMWTPAGDGIKANLTKEAIPILYGKPGVVRTSNNLHINLDIFGSAFFMISRYEELVTTELDKHKRFPSWASIAFKASFLDRPIVNEYLEILWQCLLEQWPELKRKNRKASNFITCDVDWPYDRALYSIKNAAIKSAQLIIKDKNIFESTLTLLNYISNKIGIKVRDKNRENINWMMEVNEKYGNIIAFYFITKNTSKLDTDEDFDSLKMRELFREINKRGHEIGIHPGYETYTNPVNFKETIEKLKKIFKEEKIHQYLIGGRQHFLRWDTSKTPHIWEQNNIDYDSTLSYADRAGFRCGVCYEYSMYDVINRKKFNLKQRPLIVMESTLIEERYEGLGYSHESLEKFKYYKNICHQYEGVFNLLWHNCHFDFKIDKIFYEEIIS